MKFSFVTLFPEEIERNLLIGVVGRAFKAGLLHFQTQNPRAFATDLHKTVDDRPFGGGDGMVMLADPLKAALEQLSLTTSEEANSRTTSADGSPNRRTKIIYLSPQGRRLNEAWVQDAVQNYDHLVWICGRYAGVDQRFINHYVDEELSIGDYVVSGGELAALVATDAVARKIPGVLGHGLSAAQDSFAAMDLLEAPQFTRPENWEEVSIPAVLRSGHHRAIEEWREALRVLVTLAKRPDLIQRQLQEEHDPEISSEALAGFKKPKKTCPKGKMREMLSSTQGLLQTMAEADLRLCGISKSKVDLQQELERYLCQK